MDKSRRVGCKKFTYNFWKIRSFIQIKYSNYSVWSMILITPNKHSAIRGKISIFRNYVVVQSQSFGLVAMHKYTDYVDITFYILCNAIRNLIDNMERRFFYANATFFTPHPQGRYFIKHSFNQSIIQSIN